MKKGCLIAVIAVVVVVVLVGVWAVGSRNSFVTKEEGVASAWSQVENVYQRRADLIPNLVETVKGYATHEQTTLEGVVNARAKATQITVDPDKIDAASLRRYQEAQGELGAALGRLLAVSENYPDLKANENFLQLQAQLEGTENRIAVDNLKNLGYVHSGFNLYYENLQPRFLFRLNLEGKSFEELFKNFRYEARNR